MIKLYKIQQACLKASAKPGGYHMYTAGQRDAALSLQRHGLVTVGDPRGPYSHGVVQITPEGQKYL